MKKIRVLVCLIITVSLLSGVVVYASNNSKMAELFYRDIKITLNGQQLTPKDVNGNTVEPFIIDGTTYLPVRAISNALGLNVDWDGNTGTVILTQKGFAGGENEYSRLNPAPIGVPQSFSYSDYLSEYTATVCIDSCIRGEDAWKKIYAENMFNSKPDEGMEYILASVSVTLLSSKDDAAVSFSDWDFDAYSSDNVEYKMTSVVTPRPEFSGNVFPGGTLKGYVVFAANKNDEHPKVVIGADYYVEGGAWFSLG